VLSVPGAEVRSYASQLPDSAPGAQADSEVDTPQRKRDPVIADTTCARAKRVMAHNPRRADARCSLPLKRGFASGSDTQDIHRE